MSCNSTVTQVLAELERRSSIYRLYRRELEEIDRLKWLASEKVGFDIGFELAFAIWVVEHRSKWLRAQYN